jgi:hypothetical protein
LQTALAQKIEHFDVSAQPNWLLVVLTGGEQSLHDADCYLPFGFEQVIRFRCLVAISHGNEVSFAGKRQARLPRGGW